MALRVLLADESTSIKKVMQLALQDFGVEVKSVPIGLDVVEVAKSFRPDIAFIDVLLQKRSGYEVLVDIKKDPQLRQLPIILMWSGFMDLDEKKLKDAQPDARLEKPFEAETLRDLTKRFVPKLQESPIEQYLKFPHLPSFDEMSAPEPKEIPQSPSFKSAPSSAQNNDDPFAGLQTPNFDSTPENEFDAPTGFTGFDQFQKSRVEDDAHFDNFEKTIPIAPGKQPMDQIPDGLELGDSDDGFTHVPLSALKQNQAEMPPEGMGTKDYNQPRPSIPDSPMPPQNRGGGMQDRINEAMRSGRLSQNSPYSETPPQPAAEDPYTNLDEDADQDLSWQSSNLGKYKLDLPEIDADADPDAFSIDDNYAEPELLQQEGQPQPVSSGLNEYSKKEISELIQNEVRIATSEAIDNKLESFLAEEVQGDRLEDIVRRIAADAVEAAVWKLVPDIAERLVREELSRLLKGIDDSVGVKSDPS